jgi:ParB family chromosome partitioning protein
VSDKRRGLGRGLGALIPTAPTAGRTDRPVDVFFPEPENGSSRDPHASPLGLPEGLSHEPNGDEVNGRVPRGELLGDDAQEERAHPATPDVEATTDVSRETSGSEPASDSAERPASYAVSAEDVPQDDDLLPVPGARFAELPVESVSPNPRQPRTVFDEDDMAELVHSVAEIGVLQPIVVRAVDPAPDGSARYELVMGERRWRASQQAGLATVPAIIRETGDDDLLRDALLENLHRSQLNPLEEAAAYAQLLEDFGCTHDVLATRIGRSRPQISNTLRLLRLPPLVQRRVAAGVLTAGHARALLGLDDAAAIERLAQRVVAEGLSVRAVEEIVALGGDDAPVRRPRAPRAGARHASLDELAQRLSDRFDTRVQIALGRRKGRLSVEFASVEDLNRILELLAPGDAAAVGRDEAGRDEFDGGMAGVEQLASEEAAEAVG